MDINGKTVLITGANRGLGRALVDEALKRGAKLVYAGARNRMQVDDFRVTPIILDVTSAQDIARVSAQIADLDLVINNAGVGLYGDLSDYGSVETHMSVNLAGPFNVTKALLPAVKRARGAILNILSLGGLAAIPVMPAYSMSKAAASNMTQSLRALLAKDAVKVHAAYLGPIDTDMTKSLEIPKTSPQVAAAGIFDGLARGEDDIFPDAASQGVAEPWRSGIVKAMEGQFAAMVP